MNAAVIDSLHRYHAFGLNITSEMSLPFAAFQDYSETPDVEVRCGDLPKFLDSSDRNEKYQVDKKQFLSHHPLFQYYVSKGCHIRYPDTFKYRDDHDKRTLIELSFMLLFMQRGAVVLHGSAVNIRGKAVVFIGDGGSGKSTAAALFRQRGADILGDDICIITWADCRPYVVPFCLQQRINPDSSELLKLDDSLFYRVPEENKYIVPISPKPFQWPVPLGRICSLYPRNTTTTEFRPIKGLEKIKVLYENLQIGHLFKKSDLDGELMQKMLSIAQTVDIVRLFRPNSVFRANEFAEVAVHNI